VGARRLAHAVASGLITPRTDIAASDRIVEQQLKSSAVAAIVRRAVTPIDAAREASMALSSARQVRAAWLSLPRAARVRATGCVMAIAAITVLLLDAARPGPMAPLLWVVPVTACVLGVLLALAADAFARALSGRSA
jgi:hypothetical protein